jgi:hypothetical protein
VLGAGLGGLGAAGLLALATRRGLRKAQEQVETLLDAVAEGLRQQHLFGVYDPPRRPPPPSDDGGFVPIVS